MQKKIMLSLCLAFALVLSGIAFAGSPNMKEGLWEITVTMNMPGVPMQMPPQVKTQCMTKDDLIPQKGPVERCNGCKIIETKTKGDTVLWIEECASPDGTVRAEGKITYFGDSLNGKVKITQNDMLMWQEISGKWVGDCKK